MSLAALAVGLDLTTVQSNISSLQADFTSLEMAAVQVVSETVPAVTDQGKIWQRLVSGRFEASYYFQIDTWYTPLPWSVGMVLLFATTTTLPIGWEVVSALTGPTGYVYASFTGQGLSTDKSGRYWKAYSLPWTGNSAS